MAQKKDMLTKMKKMAERLRRKTDDRGTAKYTLSAIGGLFGVSQQAVTQWFNVTTDCDAKPDPLPTAKVTVPADHRPIISDPRQQSPHARKEPPDGYGDRP